MNVYEQFDKDFPRIAAYVVVRKKNRVAKIAFKFPTHHTGKIAVYLQWIGQPMVYGQAQDKTGNEQTNAILAALVHLLDASKKNKILEEFISALIDGNSIDWEENLAFAGFEIWQAL